MVEKRSALIGRLKSFVSQRLIINGAAKEEDVAAYLNQLDRATDRIVVFVITGLIFESLKCALERKLPVSTPDLYAEHGLFSTPDAQIKASYALGLIDQSAKDDLNTFRELRNAAAHGIFPFSFADIRIEGLCLTIEAEKKTSVRFDENAADCVKTPGGLRFVLGGMYYFNAIGNIDPCPVVTPTSSPLPEISPLQ